MAPMNSGGVRRPYLGLLWPIGMALRMTILAVPPLVPAIHHDLRLNEAMVGALTALPVLLLAVAAVPGSLVIARIGARRALMVGLWLVAFGGAARGVGPSTAILFAATLVMGAGIAISQPALPSLVKEWFPHRTAVATAVYSNGFLLGEILAASLTGSLILPLARGSWEGALLIWSIPVALSAIGMLTMTSHSAREAGQGPVAWWPDWRSALTWRLGLILGCASIAYFGTNAFLPDYLKAIHHAGLVTASLTSVNLSQLPSSLLVAVAPRQMMGRRWPIGGAGGLILVAVLTFHLGGEWVLVGGALLGFSSGLVFVLSLALAPLLAGADEVHHLSAAMFTISYTCSFTGSLAGGAIWDATHLPITTFLPVAMAGMAMAALVVHLNVEHVRN